MLQVRKQPETEMPMVCALASGTPKAKCPTRHRSTPGENGRSGRRAAATPQAVGLRATVRRVLETPSYRQSAMQLSEAIYRAGGVQRASEIVEWVVKLGPTDLGAGDGRRNAVADDPRRR